MAHALQLLIENPRAIVLSIDGIGAFDLISLKSMFEVLMRVEGACVVCRSSGCSMGDHHFTLGW